MEILEEKPMNVVELSVEIAKIKKREEEVNFRVGKVEEFLGFFLKLKPADAKAMQAELEKLNIPRLRDVHIHKLIDLMPATADDVKMVLEGYTITITKANCEQIAEVLKKCKKE